MPPPWCYEHMCRDYFALQIFLLQVEVGSAGIKKKQPYGTFNLNISVFVKCKKWSVLSLTINPTTTTTTTTTNNNNNNNNNNF